MSDSSLQFDREVKLPLYARHGVSEVWVVDVQSAVVEVHTAPEGGSYRDLLEGRRGDSLAPRAFSDLAFEVETIVG